MKQTTSNLFLIRPFRFFSNPETSVNNYFQANMFSGNDVDVAKEALIEFDNFFKTLQSNHLNVFLFDDFEKPITPDCIFPNNWISTYQDGKIFIHSMFAKNRRLERRDDIVSFLKQNFHVSKIFNDAELNEKKNQFLEGTGSLVLDRENKIAYMALSERSSYDLLVDFCQKTNFQAIVFSAFQKPKKIIYHTNVMMSVCEKFAIVCLDSIVDVNEKKKVFDFLIKTKKEIISISLEQVNNFCGNVLGVKNKNGESLLVMSTNAFNSFTKNQKKIINRSCKIVHSPLDTIEKYGGGGARCMLAEIFLNKT